MNRSCFWSFATLAKIGTTIDVSLVKLYIFNIPLQPHCVSGTRLIYVTYNFYSDQTFSAADGEFKFGMSSEKLKQYERRSVQHIHLFLIVKTL